MKKKFLAMYALIGVLVASPIFTSCVDDTVSDSVEAIRDAKAEALKAEAAYNKAQADAVAILAQSEAALNNAKAALKQADAAYREAEAKEYELKNKLAEAVYDDSLATALAKAEAARIEAEKLLAIAKAEAEKAIEKAIWEAEVAHKKAQEDYEKAIAGLANENKFEAEKLSDNVKAILNGGQYFALNNAGMWQLLRTYSQTYSKANSYTAINPLISGLATEKAALIKLQYGLEDIEEWVAEEKEKNDKTIAENTALIKKYTELMASSSREALEKEYEAAKDAIDKNNDLLPEVALKVQKAKDAVSEFNKVSMAIDPIQMFYTDPKTTKYLTPKKAEEVEDTIFVVDGSYSTKKYTLTSVLEHTAEDAEELDDDIVAKGKDIDTQKTKIDTQKTKIDTQKTKIEAKEAEIEKLNTEYQRNLAVEKVKLADLQKKYDEVIASEGYKAALKKLEDAVTAAQAAFDKNPTDMPKEQAKNEDGTPKVDANGDPVYVQGTKQDLEDAEKALEDFKDGTTDYNYGTENEPLYLTDLKQNLDEKQFDIEDLETDFNDDLTKLEDELEDLIEGTDSEKGLEALEADLLSLETELTTLNEDLETLKKYQTILADDSKEMKAYLELCKKRAELEKAQFAVETEEETLEANNDYWGEIKTALENFIGNEKTEGSLPDYEALIESCEDEIKIAERANETLATTTSSIKIDGVEKSKEAVEKLLADKEAEIAAMEAELETRQAEYDAEVAALKALLSETEE